MTNFEKYKDEILRIATESNEAPAMEDGMLTACRGLSCEECDFNEDNCVTSFFNWLYEDDDEEHDGCDGCKYKHKAEDESPCTECSSNYTSKWERRPKKTRQDEFLEIFPNAKIGSSSILDICPKTIDTTHLCEGIIGIKTCLECSKDYWLQEVEE